MRTRSSRPFFLVALPLALTFSSRARGDAATAQALFDDAKRLMEQHQYPQACARFEESQRQDPGVGTLFHLAECDEHLGKIASAWAAYLEVAAQAGAQGEAARDKVARERASALEPRLPWLTIDPGAETATPSLEVFRDGNLVGSGQWGVAVPVDPGDHRVEAHAPGKGPWSSVTKVEERERVVVTVPLLAPTPLSLPASAATTTSAAEVPSPGRGTGQRVAGVVLATLGVAGLGAGTYFGLLSKSRHDAAAPHCSGDACDAEGVSLRDDARSSGDASTIAFAVGAAALVGGIVAYVTAPSGSASAAPRVAVGPGTLMLQGKW
jgi:hypothetical protein